MSNEVINWAYKQDLPMNEKFTLVSLADYADEKWSCFPSQATAARRLGCSERTARRLIYRLIDRGYVRLEANPGRSNRYYLQDPGQIVRPDNLSPRTTVSGAPDNSVRGPRTPVSSEPSITPQPSLRHAGEASEYTEAFDAWWSVYPRKESKRDAFKAYKAAMKKVPHRDLVEATRRYAHDCKGVEARYIKYPAGWLRDERWLDYPPKTSEALTVEEIDEALGPDNWTPERPEEGFASVQEELDWTRAQHAAHQAERRQRAWEVIHGGTV